MPIGFIDGLEDFSSPMGLTGGSLVTARNGKGCQFTSQDRYLEYDAYTVPASKSMTVGFAWRPIGFRSPWHVVASLVGDMGNGVGSSTRNAHLHLLVFPDGSLQLKRSRFGGHDQSAAYVLASTPPGAVTLGAWHYMEVYGRIGLTTGAAACRVNTTTRMSVTNVRVLDDFYGHETMANLHTFGFGRSNANDQGVIDDIYCVYGEADESWLGDVVVETLLPNANGTHSEWRGSDGNSVDNYLLVDEAVISTSDRVSSTINGQRDSYQMGNLAQIAANVLCVQHNAVLARADTTGPAKVQIVNYGSGGAQTQSNPIIPPTSSADFKYVLPTNPDTGAAWTVAEVQGMQSGAVYLAGTPGGAPGTDVLIEPFHNLAAWTNVGASTTVAGRNGPGVNIPTASSLSFPIPVPNQSDTLLVGFAFLFNSHWDANRHLIQFCSDDFATVHGALVYNTLTQSFTYQRGGVILASTFLGNPAEDTWFYMELKVRLHDTAGTIQFRFGSTLSIDLFDVDTRNGGTKTVFDGVRLTTNVGTGPVNTYDDLYITTGPGSPFKGNVAL